MVSTSRFLFDNTSVATPCNRRLTILLAFLLITSIIKPATTFAQQTTATDTAQELSAVGLKAQEIMLPDTNAVRSIDGIVKEVLRLQSGKSGKTRNWKALQNLFLPTATFTILNNGDSLHEPTETVSLDEFIELMHDEYYEEGYLEYETGKIIDEFNGIANVFQSFHGKDSKNEEARGINSYQLVYFGKRWWIANLLWTLETDKIKIPKKYLRKN